MTPQQQAELALNRATVCDTTDILELIIDQYGLHTVLAMAGTIAAKRAQAVLVDWQCAATAQRHETSRAILAEAGGRILELGLA